MLLPLLLTSLLAAEIPPLTGRVVDRAGLLSSTQRQALEQKLETLERQTSVQIVIATIPSLEGDPLEDFSMRLAEAWRIGQKGLDNGAIVLVVRDERRVRIEVGYGLEPVIPDGLAGRIIRERIAPHFPQEDFYAGLDAAVDGLALAARREYPEQEVPGQGEDSGGRASRGSWGLGLFLFYLVGVLGNALGYVVAGILGGLALVIVVGLALGFTLPGVLLSGAAGFLLGLVAMLVVRSSGSMRGRTWTSGRGGWSSGGGFSGGGGRFGGGGASKGNDVLKFESNNWTGEYS